MHWKYAFVLILFSGSRELLLFYIRKFIIQYQELHAPNLWLYVLWAIYIDFILKWYLHKSIL